MFNRKNIKQIKDMQWHINYLIEYTLNLNKKLKSICPHKKLKAVYGGILPGTYGFIAENEIGYYECVVCGKMFTKKEAKGKKIINK